VTTGDEDEHLGDAFGALIPTGGNLSGKLLDVLERERAS
jgi:hypothetical protein